MTDATPLKITAHLDGPFAGEVPKLDAIVEFCAAAHFPEESLPRGSPVPRDKVGTLPIPIVRREVCGYRIPCCSVGILAAPLLDVQTHFNRSIAAEDFSATRQRIIFRSGSGEHRSYRLPLRIRSTPAIVWFALGWRSKLYRELKRVRAIGKKTSQGWGRVIHWEVEECQEDYSWFAPTDDGHQVLMRPLPAATQDLPANLTGYRKWYGGVVPPYWQQDLFCEMLDPC